MDGQRIIEVNGVDLCVDTAGDAADPAILLIGMGSSMDWWEEEWEGSEGLLPYRYRLNVHTEPWGLGDEQ